MNSDDWIDVAAACHILGVRPQTLYAYVSRNRLTVCADPRDPRRSLYARAEIDTLSRKNRRPRARAEVAAGAMRWGDPVLKTRISGVRDGILMFGRLTAEACAETMQLEQVAAHHWAHPWPKTLPHASSAGPSGVQAALTWLVLQGEETHAVLDTDPTLLAERGGFLVSGAANCLMGGALRGPISHRLATQWGVSPKGEDLLRRALVLLSDHELNPSSFAVRVAVSAGTSLPAALLTGLATLSGSRHGGVAQTTRAALDAACQGRLDQFLSGHAHLSPYAYGFGHPLYPDGDPRARHLLQRLPDDHPDRPALDLLAARVGAPPNIDAALAVLTRCLGLPGSAGFTIFAASRLVGWVAHAIEQSRSPDIIRPRADLRSDSA